MEKRNKSKELFPDIIRNYSFLPALFAMSTVEHVDLKLASTDNYRLTDNFPIY